MNFLFHSKKVTVTLVTVTFLLAIIFVSSLFFLGQIYQSSEKPFWGDEIFGLESTVRKSSYAQLLVKGATGQGSPSPLEYLVIKFFDQQKAHINVFGFPDEIYFRLWANWVTGLSGVMVALLFWKRASKEDEFLFCVSMILVILAVVSFYFSRMVFYYAAELRPYALWNALWFFILGFCLQKDFSRRFLGLLLCLLAFSVTASIFQLAAMMGAFVVLGMMEKKSVRDVFLDVLKIFSLPVLIALYYSAHSGPWHYPWLESESKEFFKLWQHEATIVPLMLFAFIFAWMKKETRAFALVPLIVLFLFLLGPIVFYATKWKNLFFAERQYVYYDLTTPVFLLTMARCLPVYLASISPKYLKTVITIFIVIIACSMTFRPKVVQKIQKSLQYAQQP